ncbi:MULTISPECIES: UDP-forming cellulose synthase catalytic subunit [unclassified Pseudomonas]|uniref:UDP-forming cellulose synthase catalytic subunit n=1 Tax=unclassified Pseudomonas TaxID=196821 RepID=UPI00257FBE0F|nr:MULTISPECIES: UDP-forming cellulose synthase catalytic subunit [unclassified Pseudomonas]
MILAPAAKSWLSLYYHKSRERHRAPVALLMTALWLLGWTFLRFERPTWQWVAINWRALYPQLSTRRLGNPLRTVMQSIWLILVRPVNGKGPDYLAALSKGFQRFPALLEHRRRLYRSAARLPERLPLATLKEETWSSLSVRAKCILGGAFALIATPLLLLCVTQPFEIGQQIVFIAMLWALAMVIRKMPGRFPTLALIILSLLVSCRYFWWRYTQTLNWENPLDVICGLLLLLAETYSWLVLILGYFQTIWPLDREPYPLPLNIAEWPSVDIYIPTYNEDLAVVRSTVLASLGIDWPKDKLNIYILDDGKRESFRQFAAEVGVHYLIRSDNRHAKAGNLNAAMKVTKGDFLVIFDCDHIPTSSFLQMTMGWFLKSPKLGVMQTPHHFLSPDPFERNLGNFRRTPNENTLFYGLVQNGNDMWDATFFCGSCAILRRTAVESIGGFAVETVTEDAHTSLRLHRNGWTSAYIRIPQAAGLATESLSAHIGQRIRWARGMVQIFRLDNPLMGKGLSLPQRLCYCNAMLHFLAGVPRLIYLLSPLAFLILHAYILYAPALLILLFVLPHIAHASITNSRIQGRYRYSFWSEIYETVLSWYIARPTTVALINPHKGKFNVTAKGGLVEENVFDWTISKSFLFLAGLNVVGLLFGVYRYVTGPAVEQGTVIISMLWTVYNLIILGGAIAVAAEVRQVRRTHRVDLRLPAAIRLTGGHVYACTLTDYSDGGVGLELPPALDLKTDEQIFLQLKRGLEEYSFATRVRNQRGRVAGLELEPMDVQTRINFVQCTFAHADTWAQWQESFVQDSPLRSILAIIRVGLSGYKRMLQHSPRLSRPLIKGSVWLVEKLVSFIPVTPVLPPKRTQQQG